MGKLKPLSQNKVIGILESNGFREVRSGKHITFKRVAKDGRVLTTWLPHHRTVTVFVIRYVIRQTEKAREEFEK
ncbi:MAG: type II toxin-antitoxin system HicA family toxin [Patescibacteria group bacterium]